MPRQRGIGMRKPKKKKVEPLDNAEEIPLPPPAAPENDPPPSPDPKLTIRARPQQSPSYHLEKINKVLLDIEAKRVHLLQTQIVASELAVDAKDAAIAERDARLHRLSRLLRRKNGKVPRTL